MRQWVISVPKRLRWFLGFRPEAVSALTNIFMSEVERFVCEAAGVKPSGFSIDASVRISLDDRDVPSFYKSLEHLGRYCARPAFAIERLAVIEGRDGKPDRVRYTLARHKRGQWIGPGRTLKSTMPDGQGVVNLSPHEFLDRLADLVPPPRKHRHRYHGVFAPNHPLRRLVTALALGNTGKPAGKTTCARGQAGQLAIDADTQSQKHSHDTSRIAWAKLLSRIAEEFPLVCPACGGDIRLISFRLLHECETFHGLRTLGSRGKPGRREQPAHQPLIRRATLVEVPLTGLSFGKSTFLTAVGLINPPTSGQVRIGGTLVMDGPRATVNLRSFRRQHIGYVFQKSNLIPFLSAIENVQIAMELNGMTSRNARARAAELLDELGVGDRLDHSTAMLSGGQQQRVAVARALANHPSVILADEPTAALDSHRGRQVMELFRNVAREHGAGVIVVTHDQRTQEVFDTIYEMEDGVIHKVPATAPSTTGVPDTQMAQL